LAGTPNFLDRLAADFHEPAADMEETHFLKNDGALLGGGNLEAGGQRQQYIAQQSQRHFDRDFNISLP